jgi:hypothetical protein
MIRCICFTGGASRHYEKKQLMMQNLPFMSDWFHQSPRCSTKDWVVNTILLPAIALIMAGHSVAATAEPPSKPLAPTPPMGWNSFDSYRVDLHEQACFENLKTFVEVFKPVGYEYFVIDAGWYYEFSLRPGTLIPVAGKDRVIDQNLDEHGYLIPSKSPQGGEAQYACERNLPLCPRHRGYQEHL